MVEDRVVLDRLEHPDTGGWSGGRGSGGRGSGGRGSGGRGSGGRGSGGRGFSEVEDLEDLDSGGPRSGGPAITRNPTTQSRFWKFLAYRAAYKKLNGQKKADMDIALREEINSHYPGRESEITKHLDQELNKVSRGDFGMLSNWAQQKVVGEGRALPGHQAGHKVGVRIAGAGLGNPPSNVNDILNYRIEALDLNARKGALERDISQKFEDYLNPNQGQLSTDEAKQRAYGDVRRQREERLREDRLRRERQELNVNERLRERESRGEDS